MMCKMLLKTTIGQTTTTDKRSSPQTTSSPIPTITVHRALSNRVSHTSKTKRITRVIQGTVTLAEVSTMDHLSQSKEDTGKTNHPAMNKAIMSTTKARKIWVVSWRLIRLDMFVAEQSQVCKDASLSRENQVIRLVSISSCRFNCGLIGQFLRIAKSYPVSFYKSSSCEHPFIISRLHDLLDCNLT